MPNLKTRLTKLEQQAASTEPALVVVYGSHIGLSAEQQAAIEQAKASGREVREICLVREQPQQTG